VNRNTNPTAHKQGALYVNQDPYTVVAAMKMKKRETLCTKRKVIQLIACMHAHNTHTHTHNA
jgi:hypothetical protein